MNQTLCGPFRDAPCMAYLPTLGWFEGSMGRQIFQSHGVSGIGVGSLGFIGWKQEKEPPPTDAEWGVGDVVMALFSHRRGR